MKKNLLTVLCVLFAMSANSQDLLKNGDFESPIDTQTYSEHQDIDGWFIFDWTKGATTMTQEEADEQHKNVIVIENSSDNAWYRTYLAQRIRGAEKAVYVLSFDAKTDETPVSLRCFIRNASDKDWFVMRNNFDLNRAATKTHSPSAFTINVGKSWKNYKVEFDLSKMVNTFNSVKASEDNGKDIDVVPTSDDVLADLMLAIQVSNKNAYVMIDNVKLIKK